MRRVRYYELGGPEVLQLEEAELPEPGAGQVRLRTEAIGGSFVDASLRQGNAAMAPSSLPGSPHGDVVGEVEAVGAGVDEALIGARFVALVPVDAYADYVLADADWLARVPAGVDVGLASVLAMPAPVALLALRMGRLAAGETVLVHAAAGNVGHLATQLAHLEGAGTVIATAGSPDKLDFARAHGADVAISYADDDGPEQVRAAASVFALRYVTGFGIMSWRAARPEQARRDMDEVADHAAAGRLRTTVQATVPLADAARAHELLEDRHRVGRVLLVP